MGDPYAHLSRRCWPAALIACVAALGCRAAPPAPPSAAARSHAAAGGARWDAVAAIESTASVAVGELTGTSASIEDVRTGLYRTTTTLGDLVVAEGFDGAGPWQQAVGGEVVAVDAPPAVRLAITTRWLTARGYFRSTGAAYRALGPRSLGERRFDVALATPDGGAPIELWFDDTTGLLARTVHQDGTQTVTTTYDDYRRVDGVELPFRIVVDPGDPRNRAIVTVTAARLRPAADDAAFARPRTDAERLRFASANQVTQLPFELINNHIYIQARVNGQPVRMLVDTGGLNLLTPAAAARLGLATAGKLAASGAGARQVDVGLARGRELVVGDARLADPVFYVIDLESLADVEGEAFDGLVGFELFQRLAVRIDYPARTLTLTAPDRFVPPAGAIAVPIELHERTPIAAGAIDGIPARLMIDTGARNAVTAHAPFTRAHQLEARYRPAFETIIGWGVGGPSRGKPVRFKQVQLGGATISDVAGELYTGTKGALASPDVSANVGSGLLRRFAVTFDYRARTLYLQPGAGVPRDVYDRAGMFFLRDGDALRVAAVAPGGPAARAGIVPDARVVAIDGAPVASQPLRVWRERLAGGAVGARHTLSVEAAGARREVTLVLAELLP